MPTLEEIAAKTHAAPKKGRSLSEIAGPSAMEVAPVDPLTGRAKTAGKTMSQGETLDYALDTIPPLMAMAATAPISGPTVASAGLASLFRVAAVRAGAAALGGGGGSLVESAIQYGMETPGAPKDKAEVINRTLGSAASQGAMQFAGEIPGIVLGPMAVKGAQAMAKGLPKTKGAQQYLRGKWDEIKLAGDARKITANETAADVVESFRTAVAPHEVGEIPRDAAAIFRERFVAREAEGYRKMEEALAGSRIDYRDVAQRVINLEKERPKAVGGLSVMTKPEDDWATLVKALEEGQRPTVVPGFKGETEVRGVMGEMLRPSKAGTLSIKSAPNSQLSGDAAIRARSTISQRLWDAKDGKLQLGEGRTKEYIKGLEDLLASMDQKIIGAASAADPLLGEGYRELLKFSGSQREIMKTALFKMAEENKGDVAKVLLSSRHPENVNLFMELAKGGKMSPDDLAAVQRAGVESLLLRSAKGGEKVIDIESFGTRFAQTGESGRRLYADPKSRQMVDRLRTLSAEIKSLPKQPGDVGISIADANEGKLFEMMASAIGYRFTNLVFLPAAAMRSTTKFLMKVADNPNDWQKFHALWRIYQKQGSKGQEFSKQSLNALRSLYVGTGLTPYVENELMPSH